MRRTQGALVVTETFTLARALALLSRVASDHQVVEMPMQFLPPEVYIGCVVDLSIQMRPADQQRRLDDLARVFKLIQDEVAPDGPRASPTPASEPRS